MRPRPFASRLLRQEVVPSLGCTEPAALALAAAAAAASAGGGKLLRVLVVADAGTYKNSLAVGLPGTRRRGPAVAAAAGALVADPSRRLRVFEAADGDLWARASEAAGSGAVRVAPGTGPGGVRVDAQVETSRGTGRARIEGRHDRLVGDGPVGGDPEELDDARIRGALRGPPEFLAACDELDEDDLRFVREGIEMNRALAETSLAQGLGLGAGQALAGLGETVRSWVAAAVEARMDGARAPVMTSGGSGNSGLTVTLGTWAGARSLGIDDDRTIARATGLAHLVNVAIKARIGRVGPICGGTVASATGVGCALAWLEGGREEALDRVVRHQLAALAGVVCDGAKPACALKIAAGLSVAIEAARLATAGAGGVGEAGLASTSATGALDRFACLVRDIYAPLDPAITALLDEPPGEPPHHAPHEKR